jgi:hypothetical protein
MVGLALAIFAFVGCGADETRYSDRDIVEKLNLEKSEGGYAIAGDPFCEVSKGLLNDADEVQSATDEEQLGLVIASREGNVGVEGVPPFAPDCRDSAKKKLDRLDPKPKEE